MSLCVFLWFQVNSGWNWGIWAKLWRRLTKGLLMLLESDLPALEMDFLELQNFKWCALNCVGKYTSRAFQQYIIVYTLRKDRGRNLALNAKFMLLSGVKRQKNVMIRSWTPKTRHNSEFKSKRSLSSWINQAHPKHTPSGPRKWIYASITYFCKP